MHFNPIIGHAIIAPSIHDSVFMETIFEHEQSGVKCIIISIFSRSRKNGTDLLNFQGNFKQSVIKGSCKKTKKNELLLK